MDIEDIEFCEIPSGAYHMGDVNPSIYVRCNEGSSMVALNSFFISKFQITQKLFREVMGYNPSYFKYLQDSDRLPVESISWHEANEFCHQLSTKVDGTTVFRLPTEQEWEYACRAGTTTMFNVGDGLSVHDANISGKYQIGYDCEMEDIGHPTYVGSYAPNEWGACDMHGNVWEWCLDMALTNYEYSSSAHIIRGGAWNSYSRFCRSSYRGAANADDRFYDLGFRVVKEYL